MRTARELQQHPVAAVDLNLGCPAPVVYRKCAGGGLLREPRRVDAILGALRDALEIPFTVKTRLGFDDPGGVRRIAADLRAARHRPADRPRPHRARGLPQRGALRFHRPRRGGACPAPCWPTATCTPPRKAAEVLAQTGARGLMIGRGAIRNPWIFEQIRQLCAARRSTLPTRTRRARLRPRALRAVCTPGVAEAAQVQKMKRYMNFLGLGVEPNGVFSARHPPGETGGGFFRGCASEFLDHDEPMPLEPFPST